MSIRVGELDMNVAIDNSRRLDLVLKSCLHWPTPCACVCVAMKVDQMRPVPEQVRIWCFARHVCVANLDGDDSRVMHSKRGDIHIAQIHIVDAGAL